MLYIYKTITYEQNMILEFLTTMAKAGYRIFSIEDAEKVAHEIGIKHTSIHYILKSLVKKKAIHPLYKGHYVIEDDILSGSPLHKFEIAERLAKGGAVCCWSAMAFYELTDQVLLRIYIFSPQKPGKTRSLYRYKIEGYEFVLIQILPESLWGITRKKVGEVKIHITDLERTLLDGLSYTHYCGGFREVLNAFEIAADRIDITKLMTYAHKTSIIAQKRLGWILDALSIKTPTPFKIPETKYYDKLDPTGPRRGKYNKKWMIVENF